LEKATAAFDTENKKRIVDGVNVYLSTVRNNEFIIQTMAACKEPSSSDMGVITKQIETEKKKIFAMGGPKGKEYKEHLRTLEDIYDIFYWYDIPDDENGKGMIDEWGGVIDFSKVRGQDGAHKTWFQALRKVHKGLYQFVNENFEECLKWNAQGQGNALEYFNNLVAGKGAPQ